VLFGEAGNDTFVFQTGTGGDVIGDFVAGQDKIDVGAFGLTFDLLEANFIQNGNVGAINLGNGDFIVLHNVTMSQLAATDFIFG
jgi:serralysin